MAQLRKDYKRKGLIIELKREKGEKIKERKEAVYVWFCMHI
jgi:hypothetical protein